MKYLKQFSSVDEYNDNFDSKIKEKYSNISLIKENDEFLIKSYTYHHNFVGNRYIGTIDGELKEENITSEVILNLEGVIYLPGYQYKTETLSSCGAKKLLYAYPYEEDKLESIKDQNGVDYLLVDSEKNPNLADSSFSTGITSVNGINYRWYLLREPANLDNITFEFL